MSFTAAGYLQLLGANQIAQSLTDTGTVSMVMSIPITSDTTVAGQPPTEKAVEIFDVNSPAGAGWAFAVARKAA